MPKTDNITVTISEIDAIRRKLYLVPDRPGSVVKIVVDDATIIIRDKSDFKVAEIKRELTNEA
ncbi:hypothetical protein ACTJIJ_19795 [Niabella sp. 22666]|uniref:hypothetical protein n=1 Tax=Niabella sp. 22666 TaxID=3453954 RepID=UPI003F86CFC4